MRQRGGLLQERDSQFIVSSFLIHRESPLMRGAFPLRCGRVCYNPRMFSRRILVALCVWVLLATTACTLWSEKKNAGWSQATSGEQIERLLWQDVKAKNWKSVNERLAPLMVSMNGNATFDKAGTLEHLKSFDLTDFQIGEMKTETAGADLIVTYTIACRGTLAGQPFPEAPFRMMTVWQQTTKGWVVVAHTTVASK